MNVIAKQLIEQWDRQEERDRERVQAETIDKWNHDLEPDLRQRWIEDAEEEWDEKVEPKQRERYVHDALDAWEADTAERANAYFLEAAYLHLLEAVSE